MAALGEFCSLLQLGFGIGAGLSVFRAPTELRAARLTRSLEAEANIVRGVSNPKAKERLGAVASLKLKLNDRLLRIDRIQTPFMACTLMCAAANWFLLICASRNASYTLTELQEWSLVGVSVAIYIAILIALEVIARARHFHQRDSTA